ncbi:MAG: carbohydrate kinase [Planctomycetaceae bacterium]|nr:carbohydrate kinase [Planctomycetaceae bacterium]
MIASLGEILWDVFPHGRRFGGAPANFACHAAALGAKVFLVSRVGDDALGKQAYKVLQRPRLSTRFVGQSDRFPTGQVQVTLDENGVAHYTFGQDEAWDHLDGAQELMELAPQVEAVCFGTLGQRQDAAQRTIYQFLDATSQTALRVLDLNLRPPYYNDMTLRESLNRANVLKLNTEELEELEQRYRLSGETDEMLQQLREAFTFDCVALTRGPDGAMLVTAREHCEYRPPPVHVEDTVGAGDMYTAALVVGLLRGDPLVEVNRAACQLAAYVCTQAGGAPPLPEHLAEVFWRTGESLDRD